MDIKELVKRNRSYRRFDQSEPMETPMLREFVELARLSASGANLQPLKFIISSKPQRNEKIFDCLAWAGYLPEWDGPAEGERPTGYIVVLGDTDISKSFTYDAGIAVQSMLLGAVEKGYGGCIFGSINRDKLRAGLGIEEKYEILLVVALGRPAEQVMLEQVRKDGSIKYWRDEQGRHHVPKRSVDEIIIESF